jgi:hypothetical protein
MSDYDKGLLRAALTNLLDWRICGERVKAGIATQQELDTWCRENKVWTDAEIAIRAEASQPDCVVVPDFGPLNLLDDCVSGLEQETDAGWSPAAKSHLRKLRTAAYMLRAAKETK